MNISELKSFDSSVEVVHGKENDISVEGLCSYSFLKKNHATFVKNKKYFNKFLEILKDESEFGLIVEKKFYSLVSDSSEWKDLLLRLNFVISVDSIDLSMTYLSRPFFEKRIDEGNCFLDGREESTISSSAKIAHNVHIAKNVTIEDDVVIYPGCSIMPDSIIKKGSVLFSNVTLYPHSVIGSNCRLHSGVVIGSDGFGYNFKDGVHHKVWHSGGVIIEDNVEIGSNSAVDMGTFSPTVISSGTKIDNQVQIGHNNHIGKGVIICGQGGVAGSSVVGDFCVLGGRVAVINDVKLGMGVQVAGLSGVNCDWQDGAKIGGHPARDIREWMKGIAFVRKQSLSKT